MVHVVLQIGGLCKAGFCFGDVGRLPHIMPGNGASMHGAVSTVPALAIAPPKQSERRKAPSTIDLRSWGLDDE